MSVKPTLILANTQWLTGPANGFLTPTGLLSEDSSVTSIVFGGVRDSIGRACIRAIKVEKDGSSKPLPTISFDRRGSNGFDTDGTILGHVYRSGPTIRMIYVGFRRMKHVKFQAFSGLAESQDLGTTFHFKQRILNHLPKSIFGSSSSDIVACHWADLDIDGNGKALIAVGNGWITYKNSVLPSYSSYFVTLKEYEILDLICKIPQDPDLYRLGRPRFLLGHEFQIAVLTGGKIGGDYRPYFYQFRDNHFILRRDLKFPVAPGDDARCQVQVGYPELIKLSSKESLYLFNGDNMGSDGCLSVKFSL